MHLVHKTTQSITLYSKSMLIVCEKTRADIMCETICEYVIDTEGFAPSRRDDSDIIRCKSAAKPKHVNNLWSGVSKTTQSARK